MKDTQPILVFGSADEATLAQIKRCGGVRACLMADNHKGYSQPIGGVVAYDNHISISGVGFDIGCGNLAYRTDLSVNQADHIKANMEGIMDDVASRIEFGIGRNNATPVDHPLFEANAWGHEFLKPLKQMARNQLGTVGSGNHYVDIFEDDEGHIWVGVHFGSRGFGHKTATAFLKAAGGKDGMDVPPTLVEATSMLGNDYYHAMKLAGEYAMAGREWVARTVVENILGAEIVETVHNHHNFAWLEQHNGELLYVVRKGATPAFPGQKGFVGGSMGDDAVIIEGVDSDLSKAALYSTIHGAGRIMSRTAAKGKRNRKTGEQLTQGAVTGEQMRAWLTKKGVVLRGGDLDEAPQAYRRLPDVLAAQSNTIRVLHTLRPLGVAMAGRNIIDPYKD